MQRKLTIPLNAWKKYNVEKCLQVIFSKEGLERLRKKYRKVRGLPPFLHNTLRGRQTPDRSLLLENSDLYAWTLDRSAIIMPNSTNDWALLKDNPCLLKDASDGLKLVAWAIDRRMLMKYEWQKDPGQENMASFINFLLKNDNIANESFSFKYFQRTESQEEIGLLELQNKEIPYLATILDLTPEHIPFLKNIKEVSEKHLINNYGVNFEIDAVEMYFHFPYPDLTTTLHMHIRVNHARHPMEVARSFSLDQIISGLEMGREVSDLILERKAFYTDGFDILYDIEGVDLQEVVNPFILPSRDLEHQPEGEVCAAFTKLSRM